MWTAVLRWLDMGASIWYFLDVTHAGNFQELEL